MNEDARLFRAAALASRPAAEAESLGQGPHGGELLGYHAVRGNAQIGEAARQERRASTPRSREEAMAKLCGNALRASVAAFTVGLLASRPGGRAKRQPRQDRLEPGAHRRRRRAEQGVQHRARHLARRQSTPRAGCWAAGRSSSSRRSEYAGECPEHYTKLITVDKVDLLLGPYGTNFVAPAMPTIIQNKKLTISFTAIGINDKFNYDKYFSMVSVGPEGVNSFSHRLLRHGGGAEAEARDGRDPRGRRRVRPKRSAGRRARRSRSTASSSSTTRAIRRARRTSHRWCARFRPPTPTSVHRRLSAGQRRHHPRRQRDRASPK